jgi:hypothetical protein
MKILGIKKTQRESESRCVFYISKKWNFLKGGIKYILRAFFYQVLI